MRLQDLTFEDGTHHTGGAVGLYSQRPSRSRLHTQAEPAGHLILLTCLFPHLPLGSALHKGSLWSMLSANQRRATTGGIPKY